MNSFYRPRSYVPRGRITASQRKALIEYSDAFVVAADALFCHQKIFSRNAPLCVEIGFGMGENLIHMATTCAEVDFIGIDVHAPGTGKVIRESIAANLRNLRIYKQDAVTVLTDCFAEQSIDCCFILFPDPWPKKKHHKRRLIQADFVDLLHFVLKSGGYVQIATDWQDYAEQIVEVFSGKTGWQQDNPDAMPCQRIETRFERRGTKSGRAIFDLVWKKL